MRLRAIFRFAAFSASFAVILLFIATSAGWVSSYIRPRQITVNKWARVADVRQGILYTYFFTTWHGVAELRAYEHFSRDGSAGEMFLRPIGWQSKIEPLTSSEWNDPSPSFLGDLGFSMRQTVDVNPYADYAWPDKILTNAEKRRLIVDHGVPIVDTESVNHINIYRAPFWFLEVITAIPVAWICLRWRKVKLRRRIAAGCCTVCGYDLRASTGVCPECGAKAARQPALVESTHTTSSTTVTSRPA